MRYTTVIDIVSDCEATWKSLSASRVYLYLVCVSGWHDSDRDIARKSISAIAAGTHLSVSAVRHALRVLAADGLVEKRNDGNLVVKKWLVTEPPTPRKQPPKKTAAVGNAGERYEQQIKEYEQRVYAAVRASSKSELEQWRKELSEGRKVAHHGVTIAPNLDNINWLTKVIDTL